MATRGASGACSGRRSIGTFDLLIVSGCESYPAGQGGVAGELDGSVYPVIGAELIGQGVPSTFVGGSGKGGRALCKPVAVPLQGSYVHMPS